MQLVKTDFCMKENLHSLSDLEDREADIKQKIFDYFEDDTCGDTPPIYDATDRYWGLVGSGSNDYYKSFWSCRNEETLSETFDVNETNDIYEDTMFNGRYVSTNCVCRRPYYTMARVSRGRINQNCGGRFYYILDSQKERDFTYINERKTWPFQA